MCTGYFSLSLHLHIDCHCTWQVPPLSFVVLYCCYFCIVVIFVFLLYLYFCIFVFLICLIFGILLVSQKFMVKIILNQIPDDNSQNSQMFWIKIILTQIPDDHPPVLNSPEPFSHSPHHRRPWLCRHNRHHSVSIWHSFCYFSWKFTFYCFKTVSPQSSPFRE